MRKTLLKGAAVLTMDDAIGDFEPGDVLIEGARIAAVASSVESTADEVIDCRGKILLPGLIDTHIHLWQTMIRGVAAGAWGREYFSIVHPFAARLRPEDTYSATYAGALELLANGVTTVLDFCHATNSPAHADASLDALENSGIRALFGFGLRDRTEVADRAFHNLEDRVRDVRRLYDERHGGADGRTQIAVAMNNPEHVDAATAAAEYACARDLGLRATLHSDLPEQVSEAFERRLLGPDVLWVHALAIADSELNLLHECGATIVVAPEIEAGLMAATPVVSRALRNGVRVTLGVDIVSAVNASLLSQMRVTYAIDRMLDARREHDESRVPKRTPWSPTVDARRLLRCATIDAAEALALSDVTGSVTPGKLADLLIVDEGPFGRGEGDPANHVMFQISRAEIDRVFVGGEARLTDGALLGVDLQGVRTSLDASRDYVAGRAGVEWQELTSAERTAYEETLGKPS